MSLNISSFIFQTLTFFAFVHIALTTEYKQHNVPRLFSSRSSDFESEVQMVQIVFRHGDRTPDQEELALYPANPHINNTFAPFGLKALTNEGKQRAYKIGLFLRQRYGNLLDDLYLPDEISVRTTNYDRTKMSALACLAGLYPPKPKQKWHPDIDWQPIPYSTIPFEDDDMMYYYTCPRFLEARTEYLNSPEFQARLESQKKTFADVSKNVGRDLTTPEDIFFIDNLFSALKNYNLSLPEWATDLMPKIKQMTVLEYSLEFGTDELKRIAGGKLLDTMLTNIRHKLAGTLKPKNRKLFIYSGHENNVAAALACSNVFEPHQPPYGATYILELHKMVPLGNRALRILYLKDATRLPETLIIPGCEEFCPFEKFEELTLNTVTADFKSNCPLKNGR